MQGSGGTPFVSLSTSKIRFWPITSLWETFHPSFHQYAHPSIHPPIRVEDALPFMNLYDYIVYIVTLHTAFDSLPSLQ